MKPALKHWLAQRITAIALIPLGLWFVISFAMLLHAPYEEASAWLHVPWHLHLSALFILLAFFHGALGMQEVWTDYVARPRFLIFLTNAVSWLFVIALSIAFCHVGGYEWLP